MHTVRTRLKNNYLIGISFMLFSSVFVALCSLLGKQLVLSLALPAVILLRFLFPAAILWCIALISHIPKPNKDCSIKLGIRAMLAVLSQYTLFYYLMYGSILDATLLFMTSPLFVPLILRLFYKKPIQKIQWISLIIGFVGVALILKPTNTILDWHALIGLASGLFNAGSQVYFHKIMKESNVKSALLYTFTFAALLALIPVLLFWDPIMNTLSNLNTHAIHDNGITLILLFISLALVSISNQLFRGKAYNKVNNASSLTPFLYTAIIFAGILDWIVYNVVPDSLSIIGAILIVSSGVLLYLKRSSP